MSAADMVCPHCWASMRGDQIPDEYRKHLPTHDEDMVKHGHCFCLPYGDSTHFSRVIGHEIPGVYDGVLFWACPDCSLAWPRFTDGLGRLTVDSAAAVVRHNEAVMQARAAATQ